jgi:hypothetical protein
MDRERGQSVLAPTFPSGAVHLNFKPATALLKNLNAGARVHAFYSTGKNTPDGSRAAYPDDFGMDGRQNVSQHPDLQLKDGEIMLVARAHEGSSSASRGYTFMAGSNQRNRQRQEAQGANACIPGFTSLAGLPGPADITKDRDGSMTRRRHMANFHPMCVVTEPDSRADNRGNIAGQITGLKTMRNNGTMPIAIGNRVRAYIPLPEELARGGGATNEAKDGTRPIAWIMPVTKDDRDMEAFASFRSAVNDLLDEFMGPDDLRLVNPAKVAVFVSHVKGEKSYPDDTLNAWLMYFHGHGIETDEIHNPIFGLYFRPVFNALTKQDPPVVGGGAGLTVYLLDLLGLNAVDRPRFIQEGTGGNDAGSLTIAVLSNAFRQKKDAVSVGIATTLEFISTMCTLLRARRTAYYNARLFTETYARQLLALRSVNEDYRRWEIGTAASPALAGEPILVHLNILH